MWHPPSEHDDEGEVEEDEEQNAHAAGQPDGVRLGGDVVAMRDSMPGPGASHDTKRARSCYTSGNTHTLRSRGVVVEETQGEYADEAKQCDALRDPLCPRPLQHVVSDPGAHPGIQTNSAAVAGIRHAP